MDYIFNEKEDYRDFICRVLKGQTSEDQLQLFIILLELVVTEIGDTLSSVKLSVDTEETVIKIVHHGKVIKDDILGIVEDQVSVLSYRHMSKDHHILKMSKKKTGKENNI